MGVIGTGIHPVVDAALVGGGIYGLLTFFLKVCKSSINPKTGKPYWYSKPWLLAVAVGLLIFVLNFFLADGSYLNNYKQLFPFL